MVTNEVAEERSGAIGAAGPSTMYPRRSGKARCVWIAISAASPNPLLAGPLLHEWMRGSKRSRKGGIRIEEDSP